MGDNIWSPEDFKAMAIQDSQTYIAGQKVENPERYGVLVAKDDNLVEIKEKPKEFVGNLVNTGLYKFTPEIFQIITTLKKSERGEYEITDAINIFAKQGKVKIIEVKGYWLDLSVKEDIPKIESKLSE